MIELSVPIAYTESIQPAKLIENCNETDALELVYAAGNGGTRIDRLPEDTILRHGLFETMSQIQCENSLGRSVSSVASIICAKPTEWRRVGSGDSGANTTVLGVF